MDILSQLRRDEGVKNFPYTDTVGKLTIGVGRNLTDVGISDEEMDILLLNDVKKVIDNLMNRLPWFRTLDEVRQAALTNMTFNLGFRGVEGFPAMLRALAQGDWDGAAAEMLDSLWAKEVGDRAVRLAQQIRTGEWV
jgi:lysozyme